MAVYVGQQLQALVGTWNNDPTSFTYQWQDSANGTTGWANLSGETRSDYVIGSGEATKYLRCQVTGTNVGGSSSAQNSDVVGPVQTIATLTGIWGIPR